MREKVVVLVEERKELCEALLEAKDKIESLEKKTSEQDEQFKAVTKTKAKVDNENATLKEECEKKDTELAEKVKDLDKARALLPKGSYAPVRGMEMLIVEKDEVCTENNKLKEEMRSVASFEEEIEAKEKELKALQDCAFLLMRPTSDEPWTGELNEAKDVAKMEQLQDKITELEKALQEEEEKKQEMNEILNDLEGELEKVEESELKAQQFGIDSLQKLQVLSDYFSEQEKELIKNVEELDEAKIEASVKFTLESEKTALLEKQLKSYKVQVDELKQEIINSDEQAKNMVKKVEQRAHDNWLAARRAEEELMDLLARERFPGPPSFRPPPMGHRPPNFCPRGPPYPFDQGDHSFRQPPPPAPRGMMPPQNMSPMPLNALNPGPATYSPRSQPIDVSNPGSATSSPMPWEMSQSRSATTSPRSQDMSHPGSDTCSPRYQPLGISNSGSATPSPRFLDMSSHGYALCSTSDNHQQEPITLAQSQDTVELKPFFEGAQVIPPAIETPEEDFCISIV